jgi:NADPH:quinone reductase-like Zn-dependent oxidoreductase
LLGRQTLPTNKAAKKTSTIWNSTKMSPTMQAIVQSEYGSADVLTLSEVAQPVVQDDEVLVRVYGSAVHAGDWHLMRGEPFLLRFIFGGLLRPKIQTIGCDVAGQVEAIGKNVTQFQIGDGVFGDLSEHGFGAFAEYVCAPETAFVRKPMNTTFAEAATVPVSALAALQGLRDAGQIQPGQKVLINGAAGGVGSFAVQIAKSFGAEVTGVCRTAKVDWVRALGADYVIDYTEEDFTQKEQQYDLILDTAAYRSAWDYLRVVTPKGICVVVGGSTARLFQVMLFLGPWISRTSRRQVRFLSSKPNQKDLSILRDLLDAGKMVSVVDRSYSLSQVPEAIRYLEQRQVQGKIAITVFNDE